MSGANTDKSPTGNLRPPWAKGQSGNPSGRPRGDRWFRSLCRKRTVKALKALDRALEDPDTAVSAAKALLEFGWGKAPAAGYQPKDEATDRAASTLTDDEVMRLARLKLSSEH
jgi:hypothetical protein